MAVANPHIIATRGLLFVMASMHVRPYKPKYPIIAALTEGACAAPAAIVSRRPTTVISTPCTPKGTANNDLSASANSRRAILLPNVSTTPMHALLAPTHQSTNRPTVACGRSIVTDIMILHAFSLSRFHLSVITTFDARMGPFLRTSTCTSW